MCNIVLGTFGRCHRRGRRQWLDQVAMALWVLGAVDSKLGFGLCKVCNLLLVWQVLMLTAGV